MSGLALAACAPGQGSSQASQGQGSSRSSSTAALVADSVLIGAPGPLPAGDADQAAVTVADQVVAGGAASLPALLVAIRASGLGVRDLAVDDKVVLQPAEPNQNVTFQAGEVLAMVQLQARGYTLALGDLGDVVRGFDPTVFGDAPIVDMLVDGIRKAATGTVPTQRFWGRFLVELGKKATPSYDLMTAAPPTAQLDAVQAMFVMLGVFGDLAHKIGPPAAAAATPTPIVKAVYIRRLDAAKPLCSPGEREAEILDAAHVATSYGFENLIDYLSEHIVESQGLEHFATAIPFMNAALAMIKYIATYATFNATLELSGGEPLVRTKTTHAGEEKDLELKVRVDTGKSTFLNCLRLLFNGAGLDFSLPADGPVDGAEVTWTLLSGNQSVRLCSLPCGDAPPAGGDNARTGHTDEEGAVKLGVQGIPQKKDLPATVTPATRRAVVRAGVNLKPAKLFRDLTDAAGAAAAGGAGPVVFTGELLTRLGFLGAGLGFDVRDWGERWKVDATLVVVGQDDTGTVTFTWQGVAEVNGADGTITGDGTGSASGTGGCVIPERASATVSGGYGAVFGGTKDGDHFNLSIKGTGSAVTIGSLGACDLLRAQIIKILNDVATDPAKTLGYDVFSFDAAAGGQGSGPVGDATATITIKVTPAP